VIPLLSCGRASRLDAATREGAAVPSIVLMEDAALRMWDALAPIAERERAAAVAASASPGRDLLVAVCGSGSNAGDSLAMLRLARFSGLTALAAILAKDELVEASAAFASSLRALGVPLLSWARQEGECRRALAASYLVLDGISGTGLKGALREPLASLLAAALESGSPIASIDLPSGLSDSGVEGVAARASWTLSIEPRKACLYYPAAREACGSIVPVLGPFPADAALEADAWLLEEGDLPVLAPLPPASAYKGSRGRVAVFAGSVGASGAACLASRACLAAGAGVAALFASKELLPIVAPTLEAVMVKPEPESFGAFDAGSWDAILVGPGWGLSRERRAELASLLERGRPTVIDADALRLLKELLDSGFSASGPLILTPHPGEFAALTGIPAADVLRAPVEPLKRMAAELGAVVVLKSHVTWISAPSGEPAVWDGRESGLGTAGSGDVLAGLAAGLLARRAAAASSATAAAAGSPVDAFSAARAAVVAHGLAGRRSRERLGWFEAGALIEDAARVLGA
jgi:ADP-dependent NAD(P)H-hydrate dehydratase / NAD(P)H-hydrate epimerase